MSQPDLFDSSGRRILLGSQVGRRGGEGSAFQAASHPGQVVKLYHAAPTRDKIEKLQFLCGLGAAHAGLSRIAAWPSSVVSDRKGVRGFLMPFVRGKEVHQLFGPRERHQEFPNTRWDFLIAVARNCAAAFETVHSAKAVIGDINEGNLLIAADGTVRLIDCDSFQVSSGRRVWTCDVGVPLWTSPELQARNFRGLHRTANHDLFGLALLIFRLLFMGRHPYAGIPTRTTADFVLEQAMARYQFAFAGHAESLGIRQPPHSLELSAASPHCAGLFEKAFLRGSEKNRPSPTEWVSALDALRHSLIPCPRDPAAHLYSRELSSCPWCAIAASGGPTFFVAITIVAHPSTENPDALWRQISQVETLPIKVLRRGDFVGLVLPGRPVANFSRLPRASFFLGASLFIIGVLCLRGGFLLVALGLGSWACALMYRGLARPDCAREQASRARSKSAADTEFGDLLKQHASLRGQYNSMVAAARDKLRVAYDRISRLSKERAEEMRKADLTKKDIQMRAHLDRQSIAQAGIHGIGSARIAVLAAYGVQTALDIVPSMNVPGIGGKYTVLLLNWRRLCEARFRFNPMTPLPPHEVQQIDAKLTNIKNQLVSDLKQGPQELATLNSLARAKFNQLELQIDAQSKHCAQADADLQLVSEQLKVVASRSQYPVEKYAFVVGAVALAIALFRTDRPPSSTPVASTSIPASPPSRLRSGPAPAGLHSTAPPRPIPTDATSKEARRRALLRFPSLGVAHSTLNTAFLLRVQRYQTERPDIFDDPDWPSIIAQECVDEYHLAP